VFAVLVGPGRRQGPQDPAGGLVAMGLFLLIPFALLLMVAVAAVLERVYGDRPEPRFMRWLFGD